MLASVAKFVSAAGPSAYLKPIPDCILPPDGPYTDGKGDAEKSIALADPVALKDDSAHGQLHSKAWVCRSLSSTQGRGWSSNRVGRA